MNKIIVLLFLSVILVGSGCKNIYQGEVGVKRTNGKLHFNRVLMPGPHTYNPFTTMILTLPTKTVNMEVNLDLPSKEGLLVSTQISLLYHVIADSVPAIISTIGGVNYEDVIIMSVFRSAAANVSSKFYAKDMHTSERSNIENGIAARMKDLLEPRGFIVEAVLLKSIKLPAGLAKSIEEKLEAEQDAQRMEFVLNKEKKEAERKRIEAEGIRDAQKIVSEGLNPLYIDWKSLDTFKEISKSNNTKVIITDGKTPFLISPTNDGSK
jgi:regulator of protease activity HflC (stomatin/prohibitin superfamily)